MTMRDLRQIEGDLGALYLELMAHAHAQPSHERQAQLAGAAEQAAAAHNMVGDLLADDRRRAHRAAMERAQLPMFEETSHAA